MIIQNFQADERRLRCVNTSQQPIGASQQLESGANSATSAKHSKSPATINGHATKICVFEKKGSIIREHLTRPKYGLISADSHANLHKDAFIARMAKGKWGDRIPQVKEVAENGRLVERWVVDGKIVGGRGVVNCAAVMDDPLRRTFPQRWEDVPAKVYDPLERLKALDSDRVDAEVLFFNDPINSAALPFQGDPAFELSCVQAYNDALAEWRDISERYIPLAIIPYGSDIRTITREVERAVSRGHKGIVMVAEPSMAGNGLKHLNDPYWDTLWDTAQELNIPINWHAHAGIKLLPDKWQSHQAMRRTAAFSVQPQLIPNLILSGLADRYPRLKWVCAETGMGWLAYLIQACDYLWERKQLWREGVTTRPSEVFKRQIYVTFWYEREGISMRSFISPENIMWASDYPHATSTYPNSWEAVDAVIKHVDEADKGKLLWENAARLYKLMEYAKDTVGVA